MVDDELGTLVGTLAADPDGVRAYLDRCHAESLAIFAQLSDADLRAPCVNPTGAQMATSA